MSRSLRHLTTLGLPLLGALALCAFLPRPDGYAVATAAPAEAIVAAEASASVKKDPPINVLAPQQIENPGYPNSLYYKPRSGKKMKPVIVYLHGRGSVPEEGCRAWAKVATEFGWLLCVAGQEDRGGGGRGWANDPFTSQKNVIGALNSLRKKYGRRVQLYGNVLIGFSEGAFVAQNIGERDPKTFNRWMIIASCDRYFGDKAIIAENKKKIKRVYLWTGEMDNAAKESAATFEHLKGEGIQVKLNVPKGYWHAIPVDTMVQNYRKALRWLVAAM